MKPDNIIQLARELRKSQTSSEILLWKFLQKRKLEGKRFLRQYPIAYDGMNEDTCYFIADFYCHEKKLIIELDGQIHTRQKDFDKCRDEILSERGYRILRIKNEELENMDKVLDKIRGKFL